jgi:hypothetical protein
MIAMRTLRYAWALPASLLGLLFALVACACGARGRWVDGAFEVAGGKLSTLKRRMPFRAITFGHVIIGLDHETLARCRRHEHVHVRQYERWGIFFFPLYLGSSLFAVLRRRHPYWDNHFEREAYREDDQD